MYATGQDIIDAIQKNGLADLELDDSWIMDYDRIVFSISNRPGPNGELICRTATLYLFEDAPFVRVVIDDEVYDEIKFDE